LDRRCLRRKQTERLTMSFQCRQCQSIYKAHLSWCPHCHSWHSVEPITPPTTPHPAFASQAALPGNSGFPQHGNGLISIADVKPSPEPRLETGIGEVDRVLGGGLVKGTVALLGGAPGSGKSTLSLQIGSAIACRGRGVIYLSGEESPEQAKLRAERVGAVHPALMLLCQTEINEALALIRQSHPALLVVDSIQTLYCKDISSPAGSQGQLRESTARLIAYARESRVPVLLIGHVTKGNVLAGPRLLEHMVDTVLYLEGNSQETNHRILRASKGRYADTSEVGIFRMRADGLHPVEDLTTAFLPQGPPGPGSVLTVVLEGDRGLLVEVQALVGPEKKSQGRRSVIGIDPNRLQLIEAVLAYQGIDLSHHDIFESPGSL